MLLGLWAIVTADLLVVASIPVILKVVDVLSRVAGPADVVVV